MAVGFGELAVSVGRIVAVGCPSVGRRSVPGRVSGRGQRGYETVAGVGLLQCEGVVPSAASK